MKTEYMNQTCIAIVVIVLSISFYATISEAYNSDISAQHVNKPEMKQIPQYTLHAPIRLESDTAPGWAEFPGRVISGLDINGTGYGYCIYIGNCTQVFTIMNNNLHHASGNGQPYRWNTTIVVWQSGNGIIANNTMSHSDAGIRCILYCYKFIIYNNRFFNNNLGIRMVQANSMQISKNTIQYNNIGISFNNTASCVINYNDISYNYEHAILLREYSGHNHIYCNNFYYNNGTTDTYSPLKIQATDMVGWNFWNYTTVGNYWLDMTKNDANHDGIADSYYVIGLANDMKPSMNMFAPNAHPYIGITGDSKYYYVNGIRGGNGSFSNPYRIENWNINVSIGYNSISSSSYFLINNCTFYNGVYGITVSSIYRCIIQNCKFINTDIGFYCFDSLRCIIRNNSFEKNHQYGIRMVGVSKWNMITNNSFHMNGIAGILFRYDSYYNTVYNNDFIKNNGATTNYSANHKQCYDENGNNFWNSSNKGNYWEDWCSPDNNSDGIVDFPYVIDGDMGAMDYFPLAKPNFVPETSPVTLFILCVIIVIYIIKKRKL